MAVGRIPTRAGNLHLADAADQQTVRNTVDDSVIKRPRHTRLWAILSTTMIIALSIIVTWNAVVIPWWAGVQAQWQYGSLRITQIDANVGHDGASHFIAEYYKGEIVIIEIPYTNTSATHTYTISGIETDGTTPVVLLSTTKDSSTGRLDLLVQIASTNFEAVLYNTGSSFSENQ